MNRRDLTACLALALTTACLSAQAAPPRPAAGAGPVPLVFFANDGQWPGAGRFVMRHRSFAAQFRRDGIDLVRERRGESPLGVAVRLSFVGTDGVDPVVAEASGTRVHSFLGDASQWRTDVAAATAIRYPELWPGVDLVVHDRGGELEYDLELVPGADLDAVAIRCEGGEVSLGDDGSLCVKTDLGDLRQVVPSTWEVGAGGEPHPVAGRFVLRADGSYGFAVEGRDARRQLVVDPVILWATYLGGTGDDLAYGLDVAANGEVVVCGQTSSLPDFPATVGSYQPAHAGGQYDGFIARLDPSRGGAAQLLWCTFFGGSGDDYVRSVDIGPSGEIAFVGHTLSTNLPTTPGAYRPFYTGGGDAFVGALSGNGALLLHSTYLGGSGDEFLYAVEVEASGAIDVVGSVTGAGMPVSAGAFQTFFANGTNDAYAARVDRTLVGNAQLRWGTYFGAVGADAFYSLALSPVLPGIITCVGYYTGPIALIVQFDPSQTGTAQRRMSMTLPGATFGNCVAIEANGDLVVAGQSGGGGLQTTVGAYRTSMLNGADGWLVKLTADGSRIRYATYLGASASGNFDVEPSAVTVDAAGQVTLAGYTKWNMPVTSGAIRSTLAGYDGFVSRFNPSLTQLLYCTYIGGPGTDFVELGRSVHFQGDVITMCMHTTSTGLPVQNPYQATYQQGFRDAYLIRIDLASDGAGTTGAPAFRTATQPVAAGPHGLAVRDLDQDGDRDIVTANLTANNLSLLRNDGAGGFATPAQAIALGVGDIGPQAVTAGDFDGDGATDDLAAVCGQTSTLVYVFNAATSPAATSLVSSGQRPVHLAAGSLNGNAIADLIVAHEGTLLAGGAGLGLALDGAAPVTVTIPPGRAASITRVGIADLDGDGDQDVAAVAHGAADELLLFSNNGAGVLTFAGFLPMASTLSLGAGLVLADLDADNDIDIAVAQPQLLPVVAQTLRMFRYTGAGALDAADYTATGDIPSLGTVATALAGADLDHDHLPGVGGGTDLVVVNGFSGTVQAHYGFQGGSGTFAATAALPAGAGPADVALGDLDGDATIDVVIANQTANTVTIHRTDAAFARTFGAGCTSPGHSVPAISATAPPRIAQTFTVRLAGALANAPALLGLAFAPQTTPLGGGCNLYLDLQFATTPHVCDGAGAASDVQVLPNLPSLLGLRGFFQWGALDPQGPYQNTASFSNALWVQVGN